MPRIAERLPTGLLQLHFQRVPQPGGAARRRRSWSSAPASRAARSRRTCTWRAGGSTSPAAGRSWLPRRIGDRDLVWWFHETGFLDDPVSALPSPEARLFGNVQATGHGGGHDLHYRTLQKMGVTLLGRLVGA